MVVFRHSSGALYCDYFIVKRAGGESINVAPPGVPRIAILALLEYMDIRHYNIVGEAVNVLTVITAPLYKMAKP